MNQKITAKNVTSARDRIVLTAHDLFYAEGIKATGIDRIIKQAKVTKVTFYRHFPSKHDLIIAFLNYRHQLWNDWFTDALNRHGKNTDGLLQAMHEWFEKETYRGCAFINSVGELGETLPEICTIAQQHKQNMTSVIKTVLADTAARDQHANAIALAIDGAIIRSQIDNKSDTALAGLKTIIELIITPSDNP